MYIKELKIDGFGALGGETCVFEAPVTVVFGPNEAGKSTMLRFIRSMLYGFANRSQPAERGEPAYGGRHGGRIAIEDQGRLFLLERYADIAVRRGGAAALLRDESGLELPVTQAELERRLLGGVSERLFRQLFAVTLDELQELRALSGDEVGNYLYHAGMAGGAALTAAGKALEAERDKLFKPKGALPELNQVLARMRELEVELRHVRSGERTFNEAVLELEKLELELREAEASVPELRRQLALAQGALEAREWWLRLGAITLEEEELASRLPDPGAEPQSEDAAARWERLLEERQLAERELRHASLELDELRRARERLSWDAELLARLPDIEALEDRRESAAVRREELAELLSDLRLQEELLASLLARLSPGWGQDELLAFSALAEKERARALQTGLAAAERELEGVEAELRRLERQLSSLEEVAGGQAEEFAEPSSRAEAEEAGARPDPYGGFAPRDRDSLRQAWHRMEDELREWESAKLAVSLAGPDGRAERLAAAGRDAAGGEGLRPRGATDGRTASTGDETSAGGQTTDGGKASAGELESRPPLPSRRSGDASRVRRVSGGGKGRLAPDMTAATIAAAVAALGAVAAVLPPALGLGGAARTALFMMAAALLAAAGAVLWTGRRLSAQAAGGDRTAGEQAAPGSLQRLREAQAALASAERSVAAAARELFCRPEAALRVLFSAGAAPGEASSIPPYFASSGADEDAAAADRGQFRRGQAEAARRALREAVYRELDRMEAQERGRSARQETERKRAEWTKERGQLLRERETLAAEREARHREWLAWLSERKLPASLQPELLPELLQLAEQALQTLRQRDRLAERAAALQSGLAAFEAAAAPLLALAPPHAAAGDDAALGVKLLHREALRQRETAAEAGRLDERLRQAEAAAASASAAREAADAAVRAACAAAGEPDEAAYEQRLRVDERRRDLARERRELGLRLSAGRGASGLAELEALLARHDEAALAMLLRQAENRLREREARVAELLDRRGRTAQRLERLREEAEAEDRLIAYEELNAEFAGLADRYAVLSLTAELIRRTKTVFEEERQPEVLRKASAYFAEMTDGAYARIVVPSAAEKLLAETPDRRTIDAQLLSRGTREQMYLALRFALAGATSPSQALPLLLDDLFVHFDAVRLKRTAQVLGTVSRERQVVLFTCHEHVARAVTDALPSAGVLRMARRGAAAGASGLVPSGTSIQG